MDDPQTSTATEEAEEPAWKRVRVERQPNPTRIWTRFYLDISRLRPRPRANFYRMTEITRSGSDLSDNIKRLMRQIRDHSGVLDLSLTIDKSGLAFISVHTNREVRDRDAFDQYIAETIVQNRLAPPRPRRRKK